MKDAIICEVLNRLAIWLSHSKNERSQRVGVSIMALCVMRLDLRKESGDYLAKVTVNLGSYLSHMIDSHKKASSATKRPPIPTT